MPDTFHSAKRSKTMRPTVAVAGGRPMAQAVGPVPTSSTPARPPMHVRMVHEKTTPGAYRFREINADGLAVKQDEAIIGSLYIRKTSIKTTTPPTGFVVTLTFDE